MTVVDEQTSVERLLLYRVPAAAAVLSISRSQIYELIKAGEIETVSIGRTRLVPAAALETFVDKLRAEAGHGDGNGAER